jgi:hypothetical protein
LFPTVHPCHYPALRRVFMPIAKKYGIDYEARSSDTFPIAAQKALRWIVMLNEWNQEETTARSPGVSASTFWGVALTGSFVSLGLTAPLLPTTFVAALIRELARLVIPRVPSCLAALLREFAPSKKQIVGGRGKKRKTVSFPLLPSPTDGKEEESARNERRWSTTQTLGSQDKKWRASE